MEKANLVAWNMAVALVAVVTLCPTRAEAQNIFDAGSSRGCPEMSERDTVWSPTMGAVVLERRHGLVTTLDLLDFLFLYGSEC